MSTELNVADCSYLDQAWTFIDCPGSVEWDQDARTEMLESLANFDDTLLKNLLDDIAPQQPMLNPI